MNFGTLCSISGLTTATDYRALCSRLGKWMTVRLQVNSLPGSRLQERNPKLINTLYRCVLVSLLTTFRSLVPLYDTAYIRRLVNCDVRWYPWIFCLRNGIWPLISISASWLVENLPSTRAAINYDPIVFVDHEYASVYYEGGRALVSLCKVCCLCPVVVVDILCAFFSYLLCNPSLSPLLYA
jgi:hypothetical protein